MDKPGAYVWLPHAGEVPARAIRFAIGDPSRRLVSGAWTIGVSRHGLFRIAGAGGFGLTTLVARRRGVGFSHAEDGGAAIVGRHIAPPAPRRARWLPAPDQPSWHMLSLSFPFEFLRRTPQPLNERRPMILLPQAERGRMYRVAFQLTATASGRIDYEDPSDRYLGRVTDGRGRTLLIMGRVVDSDLATLSARLSRLSPDAPLSLHGRAAAPPEEERGLLLLTPGPDHLDIVELHNLRRAAPTIAVAAPGRRQLKFAFGTDANVGEIDA
jgi:hypothetical protein